LILSFVQKLNALVDCIFVSLRFPRLRFLGKVLSAERANNPIENGEKSSRVQQGKDSNTSVVKNANVTKTIDADTKSGGLPSLEPIADRLGVDYPFSPHLEYGASSHFTVINMLFIAIRC